MDNWVGGRTAYGEPDKMHWSQVMAQWIRESSFFGIPMDIMAHFIIGAMLGWIAFMISGSKRNAIIFLWIAALGKEFILDFSSLMHMRHIFEPIKDLIISVVGGLFALYASDYTVQKTVGLNARSKKRK
jgi:hypothetical protein